MTFSSRLILILLLVAAGCSQETPAPLTSDGVDFDLNLELVLESEELAFPARDLTLPNIRHIRTYGESGFIATDFHNKQILQLDRDGNVIRRIGQEGQVPVSVTNTTPVPFPDIDPRNPQLPDDMPPSPPNVVTNWSTGEGTVAVIIHNRSRGYEVYDDQYLLHFTVIDPGGDARIPGVELWTTHGAYLGYQRLDYLGEQYDGLSQGSLRTRLQFRAYNDGRLVLSAPQAFYIFDVELVVANRMAEDTVDR